jgi:CheY-like chemotaxis protein
MNILLPIMIQNEEKAPLKILLADDDEDDRSFFAKALKELPIATHLLTVDDGEELMEYLLENSEHLPDVLFLDLNMPRKNGFECLSEIKQNKKLNEFPVIMFSTSYPRDKNYEQDMINMLFRIGALDYIRKPDDFAQLKQVIHQALLMVTENLSKNKQPKIS